MPSSGTRAAPRTAFTSASARRTAPRTPLTYGWLWQASHGDRERVDGQGPRAPRDRRHHAAHRAGLLSRVHRDAHGRLRPRAAVPARAGRPHRGVRGAPGRHPAQRGRPPPDHVHHRRTAGRDPRRPRAVARGRRHRGLAGGGRGLPGAGRAAAAPARRRAGPDPVHLRQHGQPQGGAALPCEPARQHPRAAGGPRDALGRRRRELAAALSRHGPDRRLARHALRRRAARPDAAARVSRAAGPLAAGAPRPSGHGLPGAQLRLRPVQPAHPRRRAGGTRPEPGPAPAQRVGSRASRDPGTVRRTLRRVRPQARGPVPRLRPRRVLGRPHRAAGGPGAARGPRRAARPAGGRARGPGRRRRHGPAHRLLRAPAARARGAGRRRVRRARRRAPGGAGRVPRPVRDDRLLPQPRGHPRAARRRRLARDGRPRLSGRRRAVPDRAPQGPHHQGRAEPASARGRGGGGRRRGRARGMRGRLRRRRSRAGHRALRRGRRDAAGGRRGTDAARARRRRPHRELAGRAAGPGGDPLARRRAQDVERQDPPRRHARGLPRGAAARPAARRGRPVGARAGAFRTGHVPPLVRQRACAARTPRTSPRCCCSPGRSSGPRWPRGRGAAGRRAWSGAGRGSCWPRPGARST